MEQNRGMARKSAEGLAGWVPSIVDAAHRSFSLFYGMFSVHSALS